MSASEQHARVLRGQRHLRLHDEPGWFSTYMYMYVAQVSAIHDTCTQLCLFSLQTNLQNNNNKYYLMQLLESDSSKKFAVWFRWGRVGKNGQNSLTEFGGDLEEAKSFFCKKLGPNSKIF